MDRGELALWVAGIVTVGVALLALMYFMYSSTMYDQQHPKQQCLTLRLEGATSTMCRPA